MNQTTQNEHIRYHEEADDDLFIAEVTEHTTREKHQNILCVEENAATVHCLKSSPQIPLNKNFVCFDEGLTV